MGHGDHEPVTIRRPGNNLVNQGKSSHTSILTIQIPTSLKNMTAKKKIKEFSLLPRQNPRWHFNPVSLAHRGFTLFPWYTIPISHERAPANSRICSSKRSRSSQSNTGFEAWFLLKFSYFQAQIADLVRVLIFYCFNKWRFPEIGLPLHYPLSFRIFP